MVRTIEKCDPKARVTIHDATAGKHRATFTVYGMTAEDVEQRVREAVNGASKDSPGSAE